MTVDGWERGERWWCDMRYRSSVRFKAGSTAFVAYALTTRPPARGLTLYSCFSHGQTNHCTLICISITSLPRPFEPNRIEKWPLWSTTKVTGMSCVGGQPVTTPLSPSNEPALSLDSSHVCAGNPEGKGILKSLSSAPVILLLLVPRLHQNQCVDVPMF